MEISAPEITVNDLTFLATLCILSLKHLGHIEISQCGKWEIAFRDECQQRGVLGGTLKIDDVQVMLINPTATKSNVLSTIAHEVVHLGQFMKGDAQPGEGKAELIWKGEIHTILPGTHEIHAEYDAQPWEEEAFRLAPEIIADIHKVPIVQIAELWMSMKASQWSLDLFTNAKW